MENKLIIESSNYKITIEFNSKPPIKDCNLISKILLLLFETEDAVMEFLSQSEVSLPENKKDIEK